jgi:beta-lactamase class A
MDSRFQQFELDYDTAVDGTLQRKLEKIDEHSRNCFGMLSDQTAVGLFDFRNCRLAMVHPDRIEYAASLAKIGILLAWFERHPESAFGLPSNVGHELGLMVKASDNAMAAKFSREIGLKEVQSVLNKYDFYDAQRGGGIWVGKHYGESGERYGDPVADHSHAVTVRQLLRFFLLLEQGKLVSPASSAQMRQMFLSPEIAHDEIKFVKGLVGRNVQIIRKWGSWQHWLHDAAVIKGEGRYYILVALTHHPKGDDYLEELARKVHELD